MMFKFIIFILLISSILIAQSYHGKMQSLEIYDEDLPGKTELEKILFDKTMNQIKADLEAKFIDFEINDGDFFIKDKKMRTDVTEEGKKTSFIIDSDTKEVLVINWDKKQYVQMNIDQMAAMQQEMQSMMSERMKEMESMMQNMPPEARAQMEKMMQGQMQMGATPAEKPKVSKTGKTKKISGLNCSEYTVEWSDAKSQLWITESYPLVRKSFDKFMEIQPKMQNREAETWKEISSGWPVMSVEIKQNDAMMEEGISINATQFTSFEEKSVANDIFKAPAGFKKTTMQETMMNP